MLGCFALVVAGTAETCSSPTQLLCTLACLCVPVHVYICVYVCVCVGVSVCLCVCVYMCATVLFVFSLVSSSVEPVASSVIGRSSETTDRCRCVEASLVCGR
jgi:hypothetical protein